MKLWNESPRANTVWASWKTEYDEQLESEFICFRWFCSTFAIKSTKMKPGIGMVLLTWILNRVQDDGTKKPPLAVIRKNEWCRGVESNYRHKAFQASALPLSYPGEREHFMNFYSFASKNSSVSLWSVQTQAPQAYLVQGDSRSIWVFLSFHWPR